MTGRTMIALAAAAMIPLGAVDCQGKGKAVTPKRVQLPRPCADGKISLEIALGLRRSVRRYAGRPLTMGEVSQLLWSAQGITDSARGLRAAPSAGASYPISLYLASGNIEGLEPGVYLYSPVEHSLLLKQEGDRRAGLGRAALGQASVSEAPAVLALAADYAKIRPRYGDRAVRYTDMEAGHIGQNVSLQAAALGLGAVMVGAFDDRTVKEALGLPENEAPLYLIPAGHPAR